MSRVRTESGRIHHRSGKIPFYMRAHELKEQGEKAYIVATYAKVYAKDPSGATLAVKYFTSFCYHFTINLAGCVYVMHT